MNIVSFIEKLQEKPRHVRVRVLWLSVFVCMALMLLFWVIPYDSSAKETSKAVSDINAVSAQVGDSVGVMKNQWRQVSDGIGAGINNLFDNQTSTEASPFNDQSQE